jgi:Flp pilus assembly protein TadG
MTRRLASRRGQAAVELVAFLPLVFLVALAVVSVLASHTAAEEAGQAAEAGALALLQHRDAHAAATAALPRSARSHAEIEVAGTQVRVRLRPALPLPIPALTADEHAYAGDEPP